MKPQLTLSKLISTFILTACATTAPPQQPTSNTLPANAEQQLTTAVLQILKTEQRDEKIKAYQVILELANQNYPDALASLGQMYITPSPLKDIIEPNPKQAEALLTKAANMNHDLSQIMLANNYLLGANQFPRDIQKACYWHKKIAPKGYTTSTLFNHYCQ